jgi:hypothetical protein
MHTIQIHLQIGTHQTAVGSQTRAVVGFAAFGISGGFANPP